MKYLANRNQAENKNKPGAEGDWKFPQSWSSANIPTTRPHSHCRCNTASPPRSSWDLYLVSQLGYLIHCCCYVLFKILEIKQLLEDKAIGTLSRDKDFPGGGNVTRQLKQKAMIVCQ